MTFEEGIKNLSLKIQNLRESVVTEEATKHSFVMPFIGLLGYDVFDPTIVIPEFTADIGKKKGEKVDYAIMQNNLPLILIEVKTHTENLDKHATQLERYFTVTESKFAILTNGIEYRFYSDLDKINKMDTKPFLIINLLDLKDRELKELEKFARHNLDVEKILLMANKQKYITQIKKIFKNEVLSPSDELAKFFANQFSENKRITQGVLEEYKGYIKVAFSDIVNDMAQDKINTLKSQLSSEISDKAKEQEEESEQEDGILTTNEELEGYYIVKSILAETVDLSRIIGRDTKSYYGILLDDNNRKWVCRLRFNSAQKYISLHENDKEDTKYSIDKVEDLYLFRDKLKIIANRLSN